MNVDLNFWNETLRECEFIPVTHTRSYIEYQNCYFNEKDTSYIVYENNYPIAVFPGIIGGLIYPPIFVSGISEKVQKKAINEILNKYPNGKYTDIFMDDIGISIWHKMLLERKAKSILKYESYIDLNLGFEQIWKKIRKSYRNLINQYENKCAVKQFKDMEIFRGFHVETAGKETRDIKTWNLQKEAIENAEAFALLTNYERYDMAGMSYFNYSADECLYSVGVYNRILTEEQKIPIGHISLWNAIYTALELKIKYFKLGEINLEIEGKEKTISQFKLGFSTHIFPRYILQIFAAES